ncbi:MAG: PSD1 and planctomycete cytochrome C domain-containing protein [Planctomycetota bacterium]|nr:PSD1 and planctomycete cytochrome C domain-containing protein [Planctomycetota bacterium]
MRVSPIFLSGLLALFNLSPACGQEKSTIDFNRDIKPLLSDRCFQCHGPDENQRKADLRLDEATSAHESAIVVGKSSESDLVDRITSSDPDLVMPPPDANKKKLTPAEIAKLKTWIDQGAKYQGHWAYQKPARPAVPGLQQLHDWSTHPIDRFIAKKLENSGRTPSPTADRRTLIRRLYFDLIGLPPSPGQVNEFLEDRSANAVEKVIDGLLSSQEFGERMAVYWLDQVRYADTNGIHGDNHREHSLFRDYVIQSFNNNKPFDEFTLEQLAGDLFPDRTNQQLIASGYNRLNMTTREGGAQAKEYRAKYAADRVRNASVVWMGSTLGCAECHDHKYDPFKSRDFYRFAAFFADIEEVAVGAQPAIKLPDENQEQELEVLASELASAKNTLEKRTAERNRFFQSFVEKQAQKLKDARPVWQSVIPLKAGSSGGSKLKVQDAVVSSTGKNPDKDNYQLTFQASLKTVTGFRLELLTDPAFGNQSLARGNGNVVLTNVLAKYDGQPVRIKNAIADFSQPNHDIKLAIDNNRATGWAVSGHTKRENRTAVFIFDKPVDTSGNGQWTIELMHESIYAKHNIGKFRISMTEVLAPSLKNDTGAPGAIVAILKKEASARSQQDNERLYRYFLDHSTAMSQPRKAFQDLQKKKSEIEKSFRPILVTKTVKPRMTRVLPRGNWLDDSGDVVTPGVPSFLVQIPSKNEKDQIANRYDLAKWIVDPNNPLTARVFVNRLWKIAFGEGLVRTPDDFGSQGSVPTHPLLLDYLAVEFVDSGWNIKKMVKTIVMSKTYQQSSFADEATLKQDPSNDLLARQNRYRIDAEFVRDNALAISGLLVKQVGGNSVKPYQPPGYWEHLNFPKRRYQPSMDQNQYRRGLYSYWCRTFLHPSMSVFDAPTREESCVQRPRSNTPLQALVLLNDPSYVESAQAFAEMLMQGSKDNSKRLEFAFEQALNRKPSEKESAILMKIFHEHQKEFAADEKSASDSIQTGLRKPAADLDAKEMAAWTSVARIILNLHETITRY